MPLGPDEEIVRAICTDKYDEGRIAPSIFDKRGNTSVSRLEIIPLVEHWDLFRQHVQKPPEALFELIDQINVGRMQELGRSHIAPTELTVESDPVELERCSCADSPKDIARIGNAADQSALTLHHPVQAERRIQKRDN